MNRAFAPVGILFFIIFCCSCPFSPFASMVTLEKPEPADVVGLYQFDGQSLNRSEPFLNREPAILISLDGTCEVTDFPIWQHNSSASYSVKEWLSFEGTWEIKEVGSVSKGDEIFHNWGVSCGNEVENMGILGEFTNQEPPYGILFIYDDPDSGYGMDFRKVP